MARLLAEIQERAAYRRASSLYGIGAAVDRELTRGDQRVRTWLCAVTDTMDGCRWIEVEAPRLPHGERVHPEMIERFVEREAGRFPIETRLEDLSNASPLRIDLFFAAAA